MRLLVMVPVRGRRKLAERLLESFTEMTDDASILFISDCDDQDTYTGMDWGPAMHAVHSPGHEPIGPKFNHAALALADQYDAMLGCGDDMLFRTPHWDTIMTGVLADMGGTGWVWPDCKRRYDIPEISLVSTDIVRALGWFNNDAQDHYYADNAVAELGKRSGLIRYCPEVVIEHLHYEQPGGGERDETYRYAEETWGPSDLAAYKEWLRGKMPLQAAMLRREFNPDVAWVLGKV
jgi:hypothetical protein